MKPHRVVIDEKVIGVILGTVSLNFTHCGKWIYFSN